MGKKTPSAPAAPDPVATANAQAAANAETARVQQTMNMINEYGPNGSVVYNPLGNDRWERVVSLNPTQQQAYDTESALDLGTNKLAFDQLGRIRANVSSPFDLSTLPQIPGQNDLNANRDAVTNALYGQATSRLAPRFAEDERVLRQGLSDRGIMEGSEAYKNAIDDFSRGKNDAYGSAMNSAIAQGGAEQSRLFGLGLQNRQQAINEYLTQRNQPLNEVAALLGTGQVQAPQVGGTPQVGLNAPDVMGAYNQQYQGALNNYNSQMAARNNMYSSLGQLGGAALGGWLASDIRLKEQIKLVGNERGFNIYEFRYIGDDQIYTGVMAQEIAEIVPEAVTDIDGYLNVDYSHIGIQMEVVA